MSRIGKSPIAIPSGVEVTIAQGNVTVKGSKGWKRGSFVSVSSGSAAIPARSSLKREPPATLSN